MKRPGAAERLARQVARAAAAAGARRTLILDFDGTLAPIVARPSAARPPRATLAALARLAGAGWTVAILSGRRLSDLKQRVRSGGALLFGSHGLETPRRSTDARGMRADVTTRIRARLRPSPGILAARARRLARSFPGVLVERKPFGIVMHDRALPPRVLTAWRRHLRAELPRLAPAGYEALSGKRSFELRPIGGHKGQVVRWLFGNRPKRDDSIVAIGDDRTDEDSFAALHGAGLTIRVGRTGVRTRARHHLASPAAVTRFLVALAHEQAPWTRRGAGVQHVYLPHAAR